MMDGPCFVDVAVEQALALAGSRREQMHWLACQVVAEAAKVCAEHAIYQFQHDPPRRQAALDLGVALLKLGPT